MNKKSNTFISLLAVILAVAALVGVFAAVLPSEEDLDALRPGDQIETSPDNATDIDTETEYVPNLDARGVDLNIWKEVDRYSFFGNSLGFDYDNRTFRFIFTSYLPDTEGHQTDQVDFLGIYDPCYGNNTTIFDSSEGYGTFDRTFTFDPAIYGNQTWNDAQVRDGYVFQDPYTEEFYVYVLKDGAILPA